MAYEFKLEDPGEGIHEAEILEILVSEGDTVKEGANVLVAETDKAAVEIPTPVSGTVKEIRVAQGDIAEVGDVLMVFEEEGAAGGGEEEPDDDKGEDEKAETEDEDQDEAPAGGEEEEPEDEEEDDSDEEVTAESPAEGDAEPEERTESEGGKKARESGKTGRKRARDEDGGKKKKKKNARQARAKDKEGNEEKEAEDEDKGRKTDERARREKDKRAQEKGAQEKGAKEKGGKKRKRGPVPASPAARRVARELGVALEDVEGSGEQGRVYEQDVRKAAERAARERGGKTGALPDFERWGPTERVELRSIRRAIARRMAQSWSEIPHVTHQDEIDITELERLRRAHHDEIEKRGGALSLTPFFVKALVAALKQHPRFNSSLDPESDEIVLKHYYNIGVALDSERGLLVPVIHDADKKSIVELAVELKELAEEVRGGTASKERLRGGTFSLTNVGSLGGTQFSPLVNYPEAAIFGTARASLRPVAIGDLDDYRVEARLILPVCIAFDHRINDGADAARFMETVCEVLSDPEDMVLMG